MPPQKRLPIHLIASQEKPQTVKKKNLRYNAFTSKAYAKNTKIHEIGRPPVALVRKAVKYSSTFKRDYLGGKLPFEIDHSDRSDRVVRLSWKKSIQIIDLSEFLPIVIYGLADSDPRFADLAELTIAYVLNHAHRHQIYHSLPHLIRPFRFVFRSFNKYAITVGLKSLQHVVSSLYYAGRILIPEYEKIMSPLNLYMWGPEEKLCDDIFYGQWHNNYLSSTIETALKTIENSANGPLEQYAAYHEIKKAVPCYESEVFPLKGTQKPIHERPSISKDFMKHESLPEKSRKQLNLRLIDINAM